MSEGLTTYRFGAWIVEPHLNRMSRGGKDAHLEPLAMDVLVQLLAHPGELVPTDELLASCWAGRHAEPSMVARCVNQIRRALGDDARHPQFIETIRKRGYRTVAPVSQGEITAEGYQPRSMPLDPRRRWHRRWLAVGGFAAALVAAAVGMWMLPEVFLERFLGDEQVRTEVVRAYAATPRKLAVRPLDTRPATAIAHSEMLDLIQDKQGVAAVVYRDGGDHDYEIWIESRTRGNETLISFRFLTPDGTVHWSETYREPDPLVFAQAYLAASELMAAIESVYVLPLLPDSIPEPATHRYVQGMQQWLGPRGNADLAVELLEEAVTISPEFWEAWGQLTVLYVNQQGHESIEERLQRAYRSARELLKRKPVSVYNFAVGMINLWLELDYDAARANLQVARRAPGNAQSVPFQLGNVAAAAGLIDEAIRHYETAVAMGPGVDQMPARLLIARMHLANGDPGIAAGLLQEFIENYSAKSNIERGLRRDLVLSLALLGADTRAAEQLDQFWAAYGHSHPESFPHLFAALGFEDRARAVLAEMDARYQQGVLPRACNAVDANVFLEDHDAAFRWLDIAIDNQEWWWFPMLKKAPYLDPLRADPRFPAAMARLAELESRGTRLPVPDVVMVDEARACLEVDDC